MYEIADINKIHFKTGNARKFKGIEKEGELTCTKCMQSKLLSRFNNSINHVGGKYPWCINCQSSNHKNWYAKKTGRIIEEIQDGKYKIVDNKKYCLGCKQYKLTDVFYKNSNYKYGLTRDCKNCIRKSNRAYKFKEVRRIKLKCMIGYGGCCQCCGENNIELLTVEHIRGKGFKHIREGSSTTTMKKLIELGFPTGHTCMCYNCNLSSKYMPCVHSKEYKGYIDKYIAPYNRNYESQKELDELERKWNLMNGKV